LDSDGMSTGGDDVANDCCRGGFVLYEVHCDGIAVRANQPGDGRADASASAGYDYGSMFFGLVLHWHKRLLRDFLTSSFYLAASLRGRDLATRP